MSENLRIGIPSKGRLAEMASQLLIEAGLKFRRQERSLFARVRDMPIEITFLRTDDIPVLCAEGAIDMGITGGDLIEETGVDLPPGSHWAWAIGGWRCACPTTARFASRPTWRIAASPRASRTSRRSTWIGTRSRPTSCSSPARWR